MVDEIKMKKFLDLPVEESDVFQGKVVELPTKVETDEGSEFKPNFVTWFSENTELIQHGEIAAPGEIEFADALDTLFEFGLDETLAGYRPGKLALTNEKLATYIEDKLGDQIEVEVRAQLPELEAAIEELEDRSPPPEHPGYLSVNGVEVKHVERLARAAVSFYNARPWQILDDSRLFWIESPEPPRPDLSHAVIMGQGGMEYGLSFLTGSDQLHRLEQGDPKENTNEESIWGLVFNEISHTPLDDVELWRQEQLPVAGEFEPRFPQLYYQDPLKPYPVRPGAEEIQFVTTVLMGLSQLDQETVRAGKLEERVATGTGFETCRIDFRVGREVQTKVVEDISIAEFEEAGRNDKCPCGSGVKYKYCCQDEINRGVNPTARVVKEKEKSQSQMEQMVDALLKGVIPSPAESPVEVEKYPEENSAHFVSGTGKSQWLWDRSDNPPLEELLGEIEEHPSDLGLINTLVEELIGLKEDQAALKLVRRGLELGLSAFPDDTDVEKLELDWAHHQNRPFLSLKGNEVILLREAFDNYTEAFEGALQLLQWNPSDNQGFREEALGMALHLDELDKAGEIIENYEDDYGAGFLYNRILYLLNTDRPDEARELLEDIVEDYPHVLDQLSDPHLVEPSEEEKKMGGTIMGGEYEAYLYASRWGYLWWDNAQATQLLEAVE